MGLFESYYGWVSGTLFGDDSGPIAILYLALVCVSIFVGTVMFLKRVGPFYGAHYDWEAALGWLVSTVFGGILAAMALPWIMPLAVVAGGVAGIAWLSVIIWDAAVADVKKGRR